MELGRWLKHAYAISIVLLLHINASLSLGHHHANVTARCLERERDALLAIKRDVVGENNLLPSWGSEAKKRDCCVWERVHCDHQTDHVTQLHLGGLEVISLLGNSSLTIRHSFHPPPSPEAPSGSMYTPPPPPPSPTMPSDYYEDNATFMWKGRMHAYKSTLGLVKRIDFSSNKITGEIPSEITHLVGLVSLNLSRNHLTGHIPSQIGKLKFLDSLDLSRNRINGKIPTSLARIDQLAYLDLSYNNLSGEIPTGTQLQDPSSFAGNLKLCGFPLQKICDPEGNGRPNVSSNEEDPDELITQGFYISLGVGFAVGFWGVSGSLIFKRSWRYAYYNFLNASNDWLYVKVALIRRQLSDVLHT